jgi:hypothetical protein
MASLTIRRTLAPLALVLASAALAGSALPSLATGTTKAVTAGPPKVSTGGFRAAGASIVLEGSVNPRTLATTYYFRYGPSRTALTSQTTPGTLAGGTSATTAVKVSQSVAGLPEGYFYVLVAYNADGTKEGKPQVVTVKKSGFELPKTFAPTVVGGTFVITGSLTGAGSANRQVVLQATPYPYRTPFANVGEPILTGPTGAFSFRVSDLSTSTHFRIATVGLAPLYSDIIPEQAEVRVVLRVQTSSHRKGLVRLFGTVSPAEVGARVFFQLEKAPKTKVPKADKPEKLSKSEKATEKAEERPPTFANKFSSVVKRATRSISRFSLVVNIQDAGHYRAFVVLGPGPLASGSSETITLRAGPAKKSKRKKA